MAGRMGSQGTGKHKNSDRDRRLFQPHTIELTFHRKLETIIKAVRSLRREAEDHRTPPRDSLIQLPCQKLSALYALIKPTLSGQFLLELNKPLVFRRGRQPFARFDSRRQESPRGNPQKEDEDQDHPTLHPKRHRTLRAANTIMRNSQRTRVTGLRRRPA
jgi:hypothetical protein